MKVSVGTFNGHGISEADYQGLLESQQGRCAICGVSLDGIDSAIDHDHYTKEIRGILCRPCNTVLGYLEYSPKFDVSPFVRYLNRTPGVKLYSAKKPRPGRAYKPKLSMQILQQHMKQR